MCFSIFLKISGCIPSEQVVLRCVCSLEAVLGFQLMTAFRRILRNASRMPAVGLTCAGTECSGM